MLDIIQLLPESIANQIAAGEVVQRPASVVKELIENSIDADATEITLIVKEAGKGLIQVTDNGKGMSETDARMCFERHATSKIRTSEDLFAIKTMGFRGEALASIAAIAQVELRTRRNEDEVGTAVIIEGSQFKSQQHVACPEGTSILVKNLFFNVPARRNFLKGNPVELRHIVEEFQRLALSHPGITFSMFQDDLEVFHLKPGKLSHRIIGLFGKQYREQLIPCQEDTDYVKLQGYVGKVEQARKSRGDQFFFVNNRYIRSSYLNHAVVAAYDRLLPEGAFPFFVLFFDLDPKHIDINVHPTKTEIKFDDERSIYALIKTAVRTSLGSHHITPSLDFGTDTNFSHYQSVLTTGSGLSQKDRDYSQFKSSERQISNLKSWEQLYAGALRGETLEAETRRELEQKGQPLAVTIPSAINQPSEGNSMLDSSPHVSVMQLHLSYILTPVKSGLMVIDQQLAHERICYERFVDMLAKNAGNSQQLLFPETIELNNVEFSLVQELEQQIKSAGFGFEYLGHQTIALNGIPVMMQNESGRHVFMAVIEDLKQATGEVKLNKVELLAQSLAKNAAVKRNKKLSPDEMKSIIDRLFGCKNPNYSPTGKLIYFILDINKIEDTLN